VTIREGAATWHLPARAVFGMVGAAPNTDWLAGHCALDRQGFVLTGAAAGGASQYGTCCAGIFAVGDVRAGSVKRVASGVGEGSVVISEVWAHLNPRAERARQHMFSKAARQRCVCTRLQATVPLLCYWPRWLDGRAGNDVLIDVGNIPFGFVGTIGRDVLRGGNGDDELRV